MERNKESKLTKQDAVQRRKAAIDMARNAKKQAINNSAAKANGKKMWKKGGASLKPDFRLLFASAMGIIVLFVFGWGICQLVKNINTAGQMMSYDEIQSIKKIEDNSQNAGKTIDVDELIEKVLDKVAFEAELNELDASVAEGMIETTEGTKLQIYVGNGTFADELVVMTAKNESDAKQNQENVKAHLSETKKEFQDYIPEEVEKIEKAVSIRCGCYVIVCVTSDYETAEKTINAFIQD